MSLDKENKITEEILNSIKENIVRYNLIDNDDKIVVGVSGGPDSMCLLDSLLKLREPLYKEYGIKYDIFVAHVNHMIREESEYEKEYVENFCKRENIEFFYLKENVEKLANEQKISVEMCGRNIRYNFFNEVLKKVNANKIAVAHNMDDNVETILLNIIRGCGLKGLVGMDYIYGNIIRPMLSIEKRAILEYNTIQGLNPCFDKTNEETIYLRNKLRLELIPNIKEKYNTNFTKNIIRMSNILKQDNEFLENYTNKIVKEAIIDDKNDIIKVNFAGINNEHISIRLRAIRRIIEIKLNNVEGIENIHIMDISRLFENNIKGKKYIIGKKFTIEIVSKNIANIY